MQSHVQRTMSSISVVQAFTREDHEHSRFKEFTRDSIRAQQRSAFIGSMYSLGSGLATALGMALILWAGANEVLAGRLTVGGLLVFVAYLGMLQSQLKTFAGIYRTMQEATSNLERVSEVLNTRDEVASKPGALRQLRNCGIAEFVVVPQSTFHIPHSGCVFASVTFGYEPGRAVLHDLLVGESRRGRRSG